MEPATKTHNKTARRRRWLFRLTALALGMLPLVLCEIILAFLGLPDRRAADDPFADLHQLRPLFVKSDSGQRMEIPSERSNYFRPASFDLIKLKGERRAFVLGGSTVQGRPFATETAFSTWLQLSLNAASTSERWQCVNCGGISYASYRVANILDEVLQYSPDLIILYTGHNEFLEDRTYGALQQVPKPLARGLSPLTQLRSTRWLADQFRRFRDDPESTENQRWLASQEVQARLDRFGGLSNYRRDPQWRAQVILHFQATLQRMLQRCRDAGVPVIVCTPVSDLRDTPPFKIEADPTLSASQLEQIQTTWEQACLSSLSFEQRLDACKQVLAIDPNHAGAAYLQGRLALDIGDDETAIQSLRIARDWDVCPLRAPSEIIEATREFASDFRVPLVDIERLCSELASQRIVGRSLLIDHVHPTIETHQKISQWLFDEMMRVGLASRDEGWSERQDELFTAHLGSLDEAYFARGFQRLEGLKKWAAGRAGEISAPDANAASSPEPLPTRQ